MALQNDEKIELERIISENLRDFSLTSAIRLKAGLRILMTTNLKTFESVCSKTVQDALQHFRELLLHPEKVAPKSTQSEGHEAVTEFIKQNTLSNLHLLDTRTTILPNAYTVTKSITGKERLKSVVHISAVRNVVTASHFVDAIRNTFLAEGIPPETLDEKVRLATEAMERLHKSAINGDTLNFEKDLKVKGVDVNLSNPDGLALLHVAVRENQVRILQMLLATPNLKINQVSNNGWTALHLAARLGFNEIVELLLERPDINVNVVNSDGWTPLHWAAWHGFTSVVSTLLAVKETNVNVADSTLTTPLHLAARNGHHDIIHLLLSKPEITLNAVDNEHRTALHFAVSFGHFAATKALLNAKELDLNIPDMDGFTALHWAARNGRKDITLLLLTRTDIHKYQVDHNNMTARDWALRNHYSEVAYLLNNQGRSPTLLTWLKHIWDNLLTKIRVSK